MKVSLREARKIETRLTNLINERYKVRHQLNIYDDKPGSAWLIDASVDTEAEVARHIQLLEARSTIRRLIQEANEEVGVNALISERKLTLDKLSVYVHLNDEAVTNGAGYTGDILDKMRATKVQNGGTDSVYGSSSDTITVVAINERMATDIKQQLKQLRRRLDDIEGELLSINAGSTVWLTDEMQEFLDRVDVT